MSSVLLVVSWSVAMLVIGWSGQLYILPYAVVLGGLLVVLHRMRPYRTHSERRSYDLIFMGYLWAVVGVRCRPFRWSAAVEYALNIAEHVGFALVIGTLAYLLLLLLVQWPHRKALIAAIICFNLLGICIEFYQDAMSGSVLQGFDGDAWKDVGMNALGSVVLMMVLWRGHGRSVAVSGAPKNDRGRGISEADQA